MFYMIGPIGSSDMFGGNHYTYSTWRGGRLSDCRINGELMSPVLFRKIKRANERRRQHPVHRFRWNLRRYIAPLGNVQQTPQEK